VDVASYPIWWPQVPSARQLDDTSGELRCRSMLPYDLVFVVLAGQAARSLALHPGWGS